jgi:hypothetical protein
MAQDHYFLGELQARAAPATPNAWVPDLLEHTALFADPARPPVTSAFLTRLMNGYPQLAGARVDIAYPNLGLRSADRRRCVVLHHGHYVDATYRLMSTLNARLWGNGAGPRSVAQVEQENGAWVVFLWSDLGSAGASGREALTLYEIMRDAGESHRFSQRLADQLLAALGDQLGVNGATRTVQGITVSQIVHAIIDMSIGRGAESQRDSYLQVMPADAVADLRWYLSGPVQRQLAQAGLAEATSALELSFVFGHTHKPFQDELPVPGFALPVSVFNTGGWVMDQPTMAATQGAAAVFIDADLNVASLRLFNDAVNGTAAPVQARGVGGFRDRDNAMLDALNAALARTEAPWATFSECARQATELQATRLLDKFFMPAQTAAATGGRAS